MLPNHLKHIRAAVFLALAAAVLALWFPWNEELELFSLDQRFRWRALRAPSPEILIAGIDSGSLMEFDFPLILWNPLFGEAVTGLRQAGARLIFFDLLQSSRLDKAFRQMVQEHLGKAGITVPPPVINTLGFDTPFIKALLEARQSKFPVILPRFFEDVKVGSNTYSNVVFQGEYGAVNLGTDLDKYIRRGILYFINARGEAFPAVSLLMAAAIRQEKWRATVERELFLGDREVTTTCGRNESLINFAGPGGTYPMVPFKDLIRDLRTGGDAVKKYAEKAILIGYWTQLDQKNGSFGKMYGVEFHANIVENLLNDRFLRECPPWLTGLLLIVIALIQRVFVGKGVSPGLGATIGILCLLFFALQVTFSQGFVMAAAVPLLFCCFHGLLLGIVDFLFVERESRRVRGLFSRYVNDSVLDTILRSPQQKIMDGTLCRICVLFVDIRGFTKFSEGRDPAEVVQFLNRYFDGVTTIILTQNGVVDKFLGDGVMALFNAPLPREDFAVSAVRAAIGIRAFAKHFSIRPGEPALVSVGTALHIGPAIVGNIGSERKMEYTAIGDTVNTTSRMESLNKELGTDMLVSEDVQKETQHLFPWVFVKDQSIRGKQQTVKLFTLPVE
jgi:adenylate cyclase